MHDDAYSAFNVHIVILFFRNLGLLRALSLERQSKMLTRAFSPVR